MELRSTDLPGCFAVNAKTAADDRGSFAKTFYAPDYARFGLRSDWQEEIHTSSRRGVVRGMHFQTPPAQHAKLVFCVVGEVLDVVVDLRRGSPTYREHRAFSLRASDGAGLYIPSGLAHGFAALSEVSTMFYKITGIHSPPHDAGIAWDSFGFDWPFAEPSLSDRDRKHPALGDYDSPFVFDADEPGR